MLIEQTLHKLYALKLPAMADAFQEQLETPDQCETLSFPDRLGLLVDRQWTWKEDRRLQRLLKNARLKIQACMEDIDFRTPRGLDQAVLMHLSACEWIRKHQNVLITGPTGAGKTFLACALAHKACREGFRVLYTRAPRFYYDLTIAKADGSYPAVCNRLAKIQLLVIDDLGLAAMTDPERRNLLEVIEDQCGTGSTIVASQLPIDHWHETIGDPTIADAILDRLVHNAHKITLKGTSMRKKYSSLTSSPTDRKQ